MTRQAQALLASLADARFARFTGAVVAVGQSAITADGPLCAVGELCEVGPPGSGRLAEVVAVDARGIQLLPLGPPDGLLPGSAVRRSEAHSRFRSGDGFAGRAVDAFGEPIDGLGPIAAAPHAAGRATATLDKTVVAQRVPTGVRAIDSLLPLAQGQRIGIFAASGVGKTTLVEQISGSIACDHVIACMIGERGREVERMWQLHRAGSQAGRVTLVAATSDESATARVRAMHQALALCEAWRARGKHVVLFVDSVTRLAMALREIGLAAGEPPSVRSYTPNVFAALPGFVERCGAIRGGGAITAIFTVLSETDDVDDPIVETMKSILDGHVVLSRKLAEKGHFPAIDIAASVSRLADQVLSPPLRRAAQELRRNFAEYEDARAMIESGIYQDGSSAAIDRAIGLRSQITAFLRQDQPDTGGSARGDARLLEIVGQGAPR